MITVNEIKNKTKDVFMQYPVNKVSLFGSFARGEQNDNSDIDFVIQESDLGLLEIASLRQKLMHLLGVNIDLVCESDLSDVFRFLIKSDEVLIYEKQG